MSEENTGRGAAEENTGVPETPEEHNEPASPSSTPKEEEPKVEDSTARAVGEADAYGEG
jgi:hypothetical protein